MRTLAIKSLLCGALLILGGCAGIPNIPNIPGLPSGASLGGIVPGGSKSTSLLETGLSAGKDFADAQKQMTDPEEVELGENVMAGVLGAAPLYDNDRIQRYVNQVGRWVASHSERPSLPWRFAVLNSRLPNAGAAPGGQIYITTGLLFRMRSEAELAGALAHEIAHVVQRHHVKAYQKQKLGSFGVKLGGAIVDNKVNTGGVGGAVLKSGLKLAIGEIRTMILLKLDRGEDEQADRMGMVLAARAGYDPFGLPNVLQLLQDLQKDEGGASLLYDTHPSPADRISSLDNLMGREMDKYASQASLQDRFIAMMLGASAPAAPKATTPAATKATTPAATKAPAKAPVTPPPK
jgi:predicted Zn-dependent protease